MEKSECVLSNSSATRCVVYGTKKAGGPQKSPAYSMSAQILFAGLDRSTAATSCPTGMWQQDIREPRPARGCATSDRRLPISGGHSLEALNLVSRRRLLTSWR